MCRKESKAGRCGGGDSEKAWHGEESAPEAEQREDSARSRSGGGGAYKQESYLLV